MADIVNFADHYRGVKQRIASACASTRPPPPSPPPPASKPDLLTSITRLRGGKLRAVIEAVMCKHKMDSAQFVHNRSRKAPYVAARHEMFYELCVLLNMSQAHVGKVLGFDHTTVRHGYLKHQAKLEAGHERRLEVPDLQLRDHRGSADTRAASDGNLPLGVDEGAAVRT